jgi:hypothetical protein
MALASCVPMPRPWCKPAACKAAARENRPRPCRAADLAGRMWCLDIHPAGLVRMHSCVAELPTPDLCAVIQNSSVFESLTIDRDSSGSLTNKIKRQSRNETFSLCPSCTPSPEYRIQNDNVTAPLCSTSTSTPTADYVFQKSTSHKSKTPPKIQSQNTGRAMSTPLLRIPRSARRGSARPGRGSPRRQATTAHFTALRRQQPPKSPNFLTNMCTASTMEASTSVRRCRQVLPVTASSNGGSARSGRAITPAGARRRCRPEDFLRGLEVAGAQETIHFVGSHAGKDIPNRRGRACSGSC